MEKDGPAKPIIGFPDDSNSYKLRLCFYKNVDSDQPEGPLRRSGASIHAAAPWGVDFRFPRIHRSNGGMESTPKTER
jgi:hypothetical protein